MRPDCTPQRVSIPAPRSVPAELAWAGSRKPLDLRGLRAQSLHACPKGVQALHALQTGVQALHACLTGSHACTPIEGVKMACSLCTPFQSGVQLLHTFLGVRTPFGRAAIKPPFNFSGSAG
ncbi:hypothetical protein PCANC_27362 [Puccinia coronata f. sp. avenae]|uniref:Uncharacterized protein n=1 Tax=Puccinia coronata f. sp. avenae TaxID=200324 RepID=A0A2N5SCZ2_9BASI|nr:hypothetical protein PCANC_27362 [Puccinia coronata f. sp. avenae]